MGLTKLPMFLNGSRWIRIPILSDDSRALYRQVVVSHTLHCKKRYNVATTQFNIMMNMMNICFLLIAFFGCLQMYLNQTAGLCRPVRSLWSSELNPFRLPRARRNWGNRSFGSLDTVELAATTDNSNSSI